MFYPALFVKIKSMSKSVYNNLGPGFPDRIYRESLLHELEEAEISYKKDPIASVNYKGRTLTSGLYDCFIIEHKILLYIKSNPDTRENDRELMHIFLDLSEKKCGVILDFNSDSISQVIRVFFSWFGIYSLNMVIKFFFYDFITGWYPGSKILLNQLSISDYWLLYKYAILLTIHRNMRNSIKRIVISWFYIISLNLSPDLNADTIRVNIKYLWYRTFIHPDGFQMKLFQLFQWN